MSLYRIKDKTGQSGGVVASNLLKVSEKLPLFITPTQLSEAVSKLLSFGISQSLTDVERATALANLGIRPAPEILYVLREPVIVFAPIADVPFIVATIPFLAGTLNTSPTIDIRIEGALQRAGSGNSGYDLYISDSATSLVDGLKIATLAASASSALGVGFKRTFSLRPSNIIEGYSFAATNLIDTVSYGASSPTSATMPDRSGNVYIHLVATASATTVQIRAYQLNAIKL